MASKRKGYDVSNPNLEGYWKCYYCLRFYSDASTHTCYKINRRIGWNYGGGVARVHKPEQDEPANLLKSDKSRNLILSKVDKGEKC